MYSCSAFTRFFFLSAINKFFYLLSLLLALLVFALSSDFLACLVGHKLVYLLQTFQFKLLFIYLFIVLIVFHWRNDQNTEAMSKAHAIEELHSRLKTNVESIQQLNQQVRLGF